jgi:hypothetical protein
LQQIGTFVVRGLGQWRLEKLTDYSEGEIALQLGPSRPQHTHPFGFRRPSRSRKQCGLANPRRPFDHHERPAPGASLGKGRFESHQLLTTLE